MDDVWNLVGDLIDELGEVLDRTNDADLRTILSRKIVQYRRRAELLREL